MKHIKDVLHEMHDDWDIDKQASYIEKYRIDAIRLGRMCDKFPALQKKWDEFKMIYELCRSQDDIDRQNP